MAHYIPASTKNWFGRTSGETLYLHEKVTCASVNDLKQNKKQFALLGYACDEGVRRNFGRPGAKDGPDGLRKALGKMPNHMPESYQLVDVGNVTCNDGNMEATQELLAEKVTRILNVNAFPIVMGGGHDMAYAHYNGIKNHLIANKRRPLVGIINFDAHFDLRSDINGANSGTPFFQLANENEPFHCLCLGIRKDANDRTLFKMASEMHVTHIMRNTFRMAYVKEIKTWIQAFSKNVNHLYVTIDLDGFSSAYAPGVSAPSPMGFAPDIVLECLEVIIRTGKLISIDVAEFNPLFDIADQTAKLGASIIHNTIHTLLH